MGFWLDLTRNSLIRLQTRLISKVLLKASKAEINDNKDVSMSSCHHRVRRFYVNLKFQCGAGALYKAACQEREACCCCQFPWLTCYICTCTCTSAGTCAYTTSSPLMELGNRARTRITKQFSSCFLRFRLLFSTGKQPNYLIASWFYALHQALRFLSLIHKQEKHFNV